MAEVKTGEDHLRSLRDGRAVYIDGERVADVTTHPAFRNAVQTAAGLYDLQARPENLERLTFAPEDGGGEGYARVNRCWLMWRTLSSKRPGSTTAPLSNWSRRWARSSLSCLV